MKLPPSPSATRPTTSIETSISPAASRTNCSLAFWPTIGAIVYINGTEVHRSRNWGIAAPQNAALCAAAVATADENEFFEFVVDTAYLYGSLKPTGNTIAVEVHQATVASSDIGFDLKLREGGLGLLANDFDPDDSLEELRVEVVNATNATPYGMLDVSSNGDVRFMPRRHDVIGQFTFTYRVVDDGDPEFPPAVSNVATATVNVLGCDCLPPLAFNDINVPEFTVHEDSDLLIDATSGPSGPRGVGVLANDIIPYWSPVLPFVVVPPASGGSVEFNGSTGGFVYRPGPNFHGVDSFTYAVQDGFNISNFATVEISVAAIDDIPMTVNDSYAVLAGTELAAVQHEVLIPRRATWSYFDELTNGSNSSPRETYPRDGTGNVWNSPGFNTTTSDPTIGVWKVGTGIFAQPLTGLGPLGSTFLRGTAATVTTDLFRRTFDLTAAEASSITTLLASTVYDDGIVVYVNGTEVFRNAMPALPAIVGPQTLATANPSEDYQLHELAIPVGLLNEGINTIAVEVHQNSPTSPDRGFDLSLYYVPPGAGGFPSWPTTSTSTTTRSNMSRWYLAPGRKTARCWNSTRMAPSATRLTKGFPVSTRSSIRTLLTVKHRRRLPCGSPSFRMRLITLTSMPTVRLTEVMWQFCSPISEEERTQHGRKETLQGTAA